MSVRNATRGNVTFNVNSKAITAVRGDSIFAALIAAGFKSLRHTRKGAERGGFCGMGTCHDCLVTVNGVHNVKACMTGVSAGDDITLLDAEEDVSLITTTTEASEEDVLDFEVVVVGGGAGGITAATVAARQGLKVLLLDERRHLGGQYFRQRDISVDESGPPVGKQQKWGASLIADLRATDATVLEGALVWGVFEGQELRIVCQDRRYSVRWKKLILSPGAYEAPYAVPGSTLPGVITTGAAQTLLKSSGVPLQGRVLIGGNGPLNLQVAYELANAGAEIAGVVEASNVLRLGSGPHVLKAVLQRPALMWDGVKYMTSLKKRGIPIHYGSRINRIEGDAREKTVHIGGTSDTTAHPGTITANWVCLGYGFIPNTELARQLGCETRYDAKWGCVVPVVDRQGRTSVDGVYVVGDGAGIRGAHVAMATGGIAALDAARHLRPEGRADGEDAARFDAMYETNLSFQRHLWDIFAVRRDNLLPTDRDTIVCRCEEVTLGAILDECDSDKKTLKHIKGLTRAGMGRCQGRYCMPVIEGLLRQQSHSGLKASPVPATRIPSKPVRIVDIAELQPEWTENNPILLRPLRNETADSARLGHDTDVLIVGGGIIGSALAYYLAREGVEVTVLEAFSTNMAASGVNAGSMHVQMLSYFMREYDERPEGIKNLLRLGPKSVDNWVQLERDLGSDIGLKIAGGVMVAQTRDEFELLQQKVKIEATVGIESEVLSGTELRSRFGSFSPDLLGAVFCGQEGKVDPFKAGASIVYAAEEQGARVIRRSAVSAIRKTQAGFEVSTDSGRVRAQRVVNAAGPWAASIASMVGLSIPVRGKAIQMSVTEPTKQAIDLLVAHAGRHLTLKQSATGNFIIGGGWLSDLAADGMTAVPRYNSIRGNLAVAKSVVPSISHVHLMRTWGGIAPIIPDNAPIVGEVPSVPGFFNCVTEVGYTIGPYCARVLSEIMTDARDKSSVSEYAIERFH